MGMDVLGRVVEIVSGILAAFMRHMHACCQCSRDGTWSVFVEQSGMLQGVQPKSSAGSKDKNHRQSAAWHHRAMFGHGLVYPAVFPRNRRQGGTVNDTLTCVRLLRCRLWAPVFKRSLRDALGARQNSFGSFPTHFSGYLRFARSMPHL